MSDAALVRQLDSRAIELAAEARQIAREARDACRNEYDGLWTELRQHRDETNRRFDRQDNDRHTMHLENQAKFDRLFRAVYIAVGIGMAASALLSSSLLPMVSKLLHP